MENVENLSIVFFKKIAENNNLVRVKQNGCFFCGAVKNNLG